MQSVGKRGQQIQAAAAQDAKSRSAVGHRLAGDDAQQASKNSVADPTDQRHLAVGVQTSGQDHVRLGMQQAVDQRHAEIGVPGPIGVDKTDQLTLGGPPARLDRRSVAPVLLEADLDHFVEFRLVHDLLRAVGGPVVDEHDGHLADGGFVLHFFPRRQGPPEGAADGIFLVEGRDDQDVVQRSASAWS